MPLEIRAAIYARVSTDLQEREHTVLSQLEALRSEGMFSSPSMSMKAIPAPLWTGPDWTGCEMP